MLISNLCLSFWRQNIEWGDAAPTILRYQPIRSRHQGTHDDGTTKRLSDWLDYRRLMLLPSDRHRGYYSLYDGTCKWFYVIT